jgi:RNA methyltransferase, TrmH family
MKLLVEITSRQNRRVVEARKLDQRKYRVRHHRFLVEGLQLLHMALDAGYEPDEVFFNEGQFVGTEAPSLLDRFRQSGAELVPVSADVMQSLAERDVCQGLVAAFPTWRTTIEDVSFEEGGLVLVLDRLQDPGNVGTLIRTADAAGASAVVLLEPCADPFDRKTVRGSMGSLFNIPLVQVAQVDDALAVLTRRGLTIVGADARLGECWGDSLWRDGVALILGNEAHGISEDLRRHVVQWVRLPIAGKAESLNVSVAGGILIYSWLRARRGEDGDSCHPASGAE